MGVISAYSSYCERSRLIRLAAKRGRGVGLSVSQHARDPVTLATDAQGVERTLDY
jgi:hypothetical protein